MKEIVRKMAIFPIKTAIFSSQDQLKRSFFLFFMGVSIEKTKKKILHIFKISPTKDGVKDGNHHQNGPKN
jgi:hypothetical protein